MPKTNAASWQIYIKKRKAEEYFRLPKKINMRLLMSYYIQNTITGHRYAEMVVLHITIMLQLENNMDMIYLLHIP